MGARWQGLSGAGESIQRVCVAGQRVEREAGAGGAGVNALSAGPCDVDRRSTRWDADRTVWIGAQRVERRTGARGSPSNALIANPSGARAIDGGAARAEEDVVVREAGLLALGEEIVGDVSPDFA